MNGKSICVATWIGYCRKKMRIVQGCDLDVVVAATVVIVVMTGIS